MDLAIRGEDGFEVRNAGILSLFIIINLFFLLKNPVQKKKLIWAGCQTFRLPTF